MIRKDRRLFLLLLKLTFILPFITVVRATSKNCDRSCRSDDGVQTFPYPFGFSADCQVWLDCKSSGEVFIGEFPVKSVGSDSIRVDIQWNCKRPVHSLKQLYGHRYAPTSRNAILLENCSEPSSTCVIPGIQVPSHFDSMNCSSNSNISCYAENKSLAFIDFESLKRKQCDYLLSSISSLNLEIRVVELGWWLDGNCDQLCDRNANCTNIEPPNGKPGYRCCCKEGFQGDGYKAGIGCRKENRKKRRYLWVIIGAPLVSLILVAVVITLCYLRFFKDRSRGKRGSTENSSMSTEVLIQEVGTSLAAIDQLSGTRKLKLTGKHDHELPLFSFSSIETSTGYFAAANKLGQGGFGPVYKGTMADGQEIAVKRLSRKSRQGAEEFKNEVMLISNLQHRNLVRVLGCCIKGEEKILVYEYLPNKSLDLFLFDETKRVLLDWKRRAHIIQGIAQGLLYLHKYSRLRIIHRDLKTSNILLDTNLNPKISDFGTARIFGDNESGANTNRIVGTYGYMSPEYAMKGLFSEKSDVFSFGVLMLEILSGKKNNGFRQPNVFSSLLEYAWNLWREGRCSELMDPSVAETCNSTNEFIRYVEVALLCVQELAADRPTMTDIVSMLGGDLVTPPHPKQPAFSILRRVDDTNLAENPGAYTINNVSISDIEPR